MSARLSRTAESKDNGGAGTRAKRSHPGVLLMLQLQLPRASGEWAASVAGPQRIGGFPARIRLLVPVSRETSAIFSLLLSLFRIGFHRLSVAHNTCSEEKRKPTSRHAPYSTAPKQTHKMIIWRLKSSSSVECKTS